MGKQKRKLTAAEKREKKRRREQYITIFINGKQKRVKRPDTIEGLSEEEFLLRNADAILLHQLGLWEYLIPQGEDAVEPSWWELGEWVPEASSYDSQDRMTDDVLTRAMLYTVDDVPTISQIKNRFSAYLKKVRAGESVLILDRDEPVARLERVSHPEHPDVSASMSYPSPSMKDSNSSRVTNVHSAACGKDS